MRLTQELLFNESKTETLSEQAKRYRNSYESFEPCVFFQLIQSPSFWINVLLDRKNRISCFTWSYFAVCMQVLILVPYCTKLEKVNTQNLSVLTFDVGSVEPDKGHVSAQSSHQCCRWRSNLLPEYRAHFGTKQWKITNAMPAAVSVE